jgi:hypothetical protein
VTVVSVLWRLFLCVREVNITDGLVGVGHVSPPACQTGTNPTTGPPVPDAFQMECQPIIVMRDEAQVLSSRSKVERRRNADINRTILLNNDNEYK